MYEQIMGTIKVHLSTFIQNKLTTTYDNTSGVHKHIMMINDKVYKLKQMKIEIINGFLVHFIMTSSIAFFSPFNINYNTHKDKLQMIGLINMFVQEENNHKIQKNNVTHFTTLNESKIKDMNIFGESLCGEKKKVQVQNQFLAIKRFFIVSRFILRRDTSKDNVLISQS